MRKPNLTPRPVKATGAKDAHGSILDPTSGALYVHMHREIGLAHRHYVLKAWQVRLLSIASSRAMMLVYVAALVMSGWVISQALRVPVLRSRIGVLTREAAQLDTLSARLTDLTQRYEQVQRMLGAERAATGRDTTRTKAPTAAPSAPATLRDTMKKAPPPSQPQQPPTARE